MTAAALAEIVSDVVPPGAFNLIHGLGGEVGQALIEHPDVRGISFTGGTETGAKVAANSWYAYVTWQTVRNLYIGMRVEEAELVSDRITIDPDGSFAPGLGLQALTAYVTYWQSEFVRLRIQVQRAERDVDMAAGPMEDNRAWLQVTFAAGPHKHESY